MVRYNRQSALTIGVTTLGLLTMTPTLLSAQVNPLGRRLGPDLLQTLGVGSRSIAMGNAFSAIADDASATFWNPGRLGFLSKKQFMLQLRPVINTNLTPNNGVLTPGFSPGKPQLGFVSVTIPIRQGENEGDTVGVSYTLGGYFRNFSQIPDLNNNVTLENDLTVRNSFLTIAYGKKFKSGLGVGAGFFALNQDFTSRSRELNAAGAATRNTLLTERGQGYGVVVGAAYDTVSGYHFGLVYRSGVRISGLNVGSAFNTEIPDRLSLGIARTYQKDGEPYFTWSAEFQALSAANRGRANINQTLPTDVRRAVGNLHLGVEYVPSGILGGKDEGSSVYPFVMPIRLGFRTNAAAATNYTRADNVLSLGVAFQSNYLDRARRGTPRYSIEPTMEIFTSNGAMQFTLTGLINF